WNPRPPGPPAGHSACPHSENPPPPAAIHHLRTRSPTAMKGQGQSGYTPDGIALALRLSRATATGRLV
ncbi:MAG: hypothetical protein ACRDSL_25245, partial [Pseudonocardiaceae bacterium]